MRNDDSLGFIRKNPSFSLSAVAAAFISALFLSLLSGLFFNFWNYEIERIVLAEGDWQGRITGTFDEPPIPVIENFANVEQARINADISKGRELVIDIYFHNMRTIYRDMPLITQKLGIPDSAASFHELLLSRYLIHDPQDPEPPLLMAFFLAVFLFVSISLILIIHNSFALSMNTRVHQFGILSSIGATPGQIRTCLLREAMALCIVPILAGNLAGTALSFGVVQITNALAAEIPGRHEASFAYHPLLFAAALIASLLTVCISAWLPARKLGRLTPLAAIRDAGELQLNTRKKSPILSALFGIEGELAGNALKAQKKALRTSALSLTLSFLGFTLMLCFFTLSGISTNHTYFERYQDAWDILVTAHNTDIASFPLEEKISKLSGAADIAVYQKADAVSRIPQAAISDAVNKLGGLEAVAGDSVRPAQSFYSIPTSLVIMNDRSFQAYCEQTGTAPSITGCIVLNRIWDSVHSNFRYKDFIPYLSEKQNTITLLNPQQAESSAVLPIRGFAQEPPLLREEYDNYALAVFLPLSLWSQIGNSIGNAQPDTYVRVLAKDRTSLSSLQALEEELSEILEGTCSFETENRIQEKADNDRMLRGYMLFTGALCALLAVIGLANVFSNTLGFVQQRKREFARYMSVGMTPEGMRKMFCIEALVIAGRPLFITLPLTLMAVGFMIKASYLNPMEFLKEAPILPITAFILAVFGFVALAYWLGGRKILRCDLTEALRNDSMG